MSRCRELTRIRRVGVSDRSSQDRDTDSFVYLKSCEAVSRLTTAKLLECSQSRKLLRTDGSSRSSTPTPRAKAAGFLVLRARNRRVESQMHDDDGLAALRGWDVPGKAADRNALWRRRESRCHLRTRDCLLEFVFALGLLLELPFPGLEVRCWRAGGTRLNPRDWPNLTRRVDSMRQYSYILSKYVLSRLAKHATKNHVLYVSIVSYFVLSLEP